jgi:polyisoprenoid-binding protein YceI
MKQFTQRLSLILVAALALLSTHAHAQSPASSATKLIPEQSVIAFTSKQMGVPVDGRFGKFDAQISFDPKQAAARMVQCR